MSIIVRSNEKPAAESPAANTEGAKSQGQSGEKTVSAPEAKASEQKESGASETQETEEEESETDGSEEAEGEEGSSNEASSKEESDQDEKTGKKKSGIQRRVNKLNARVTAAQQEAEYWKQQALKSANAPKEDASKVDQGTKSTTVTPEAKPKPDDFETHAEYVEAIADFKAEQKLRERDQKAEKERLQSEQSKLVTTYAERAKSFAEKTADFDDVLSEVDDVPLSVAVREIILQADNGPELAYELAKNREEYARVCKLSPMAAAREMGKLEARIAAKTSAGAKAESKKITKAPKPLDPVGTGGKGAVTKSLSDPNLSQAEYERLRAEQINKKRRQA